MIKAIIFDWHGVLDKTDYDTYINKIASLSGKSFDETANMVAAYDHLTVRSEMSPRDFWNKIKDIFSFDDNSIGQVKEEILNVIPNKSLWALLPELKKKYKLAVLSDVSADKAQIIRQYPGLTIFDQVYLSNEVGLNKKDNKEYFLKIAEALGEKTENCLFADDRSRHVETARKLGFKGCLFSKTEDLEKCLKEYE